MQKWVKLENNRLLKLEGYNLISGWHTYYTINTKMTSFSNKIRKTLFPIWQKYKRMYGEKKPMLVIPLDVLKQKVERGMN